ncbi:hypothetical protein PAERUG_P7_London_17_VIM_2_06_09_05632 [Pseudomonas aeruginosa]|nr:hypothetical protein PAERUG_P13_London_14_VIM_2_12_09_04929 [Pseudomonas aeruginosa]CRN99870.1 hypothetical protein PAERUG_P14_London_17_VIM_2_01_10_00577 [Pseudomonas aeruginosa]CRO18185.1 hypothetical protein PAERUG_E4_London_17_VIM_2_03_09_05282 [Pseudomonas aeruginosa]CRO56254.1 hypothetical protein PAERUG_P23_East_of_England_6_IMP_13_07_10_05256 [Pseudomonas aeruginosa]CRO99711.1 hypothetical protein PAERUG_P17_North_West_14_VIM_2_03_10_05737 [Pseudomonas aeruginosa]
MVEHDQRHEGGAADGPGGEGQAPAEEIGADAGGDLAEDHRAVGADHVAGHRLEVHPQLALQVGRHPVVGAVVAEQQEAGGEAPEQEHAARFRIAQHPSQRAGAASLGVALRSRAGTLAPGLGREPGRRLRHPGPQGQADQRRRHGGEEQGAPAKLGDDLPRQQGRHQVAHGPAGLHGGEDGGAVPGSDALGHQDVAGDEQRAEAERGDEADQRELPVVLGQPQQRGTDGEQHDGPGHHPHPAEAVAAPAAIDAADGHAGESQAAEGASFEVAQAEFGLQAVEAVGQEHQVDAVGEQAEEAEDEGDQHGAPGDGRRRVRGKRGCIHYSCSRKQDFG